MPCEINWLVMSKKTKKSKKMDCYLLSNFIFIGIETIFFIPIISVLILTEDYTVTDVDWSFNYYITTFFITIIHFIIILIYSIMIINKGNSKLKKGKKTLNEYYSIEL